MNPKYLLILMALIFAAWLDPYRDEVSRGNTEFHGKKYSDAKGSYDRAEKYAPGENDKNKLSFNKGDANYMLENFTSAEADFQKAVQSEDKDVQKKAFFNMGNAFLKTGKKNDAAGAYIKALQIDPSYEPAKKNLEYLLNKKKDDEKKKDGKDKKDGKGGNDKNKKENEDKNKNDKNDKKNQQQQNSSGMNRDQVKNILESMKNKPVKREKGSGNDKRFLDKAW